mmetsp:Transcript_23762/g.44123  ORF Transcript_23762/g.44123 Transcript_23762/m.44123 type:complete len:510 (-) Transcript_23762:209-1738(-)
MATPSPPHYDVIIIGGGLSGICAGYHLKKRCPDKSFIILEGRERIGGTWDLFRYPGVRSDSDMYTMGYSFEPWLGERSLADGKSILSYIHKTSEKYDIKSHIVCNRWVKTVSFSSQTNTWTLDTEHRQPNNDEVFDDELAAGSVSMEAFTCSFMFNCTGYYNYDAGYTPDFPGMERFSGQVVHPQKWPEDLDYSNKKVVIIGSGATAVTLLPAMADRTKHITMLQRSPTYIASVPLVDPVATFLHSIPFLPTSCAHFLIRWKNILGTMLLFWQAKTYPLLTKKYLRKEIKRYLGEDTDCDVNKHFTPAYDPWDQRLCAVPDNDFFKAIKDKKASVVTDHIDTITETGIRLKDCGTELPADIIITATGLTLQLFGGVSMFIDGKPMDMTNTRVYKGVMLSNIPNAAMSVGYTNATWTLKCDLTCEYVCKVLQYMDRHHYKRCVPHLSVEDNATQPTEPLLNLNSSYITRSVAAFPKQGTKAPWKYYQNFLKDIRSLRYGTLFDGVLRFAK